MSPIERFAYNHPAMFAALVTILVGLAVFWLTGDFSPVEAIRHVKGF